MSSHSDREISYGSYLQLNSILNSQSPVSSDTPSPAHDEMLFIIIHQVYELWFKQILHELDSVMSMFREDYVDEKNIGVAVSRLERVVEIEKVIIDQIRILETMTPLDFLEFRNLLTPASGFQSLQFRILEIKLGLRTAERIRYSQTAYQHHYPEGEQTLLAGLEQQASLFELLENWLERTPFLEYTGFNFTRTFREAVEQMLAAEWEMVENSAMSVGEKEQRRQMMETNRRHFESLLDPAQHQQLIDEGRRRLSHKATLAALFIHLYRDQPILHLPFQLLSAIVDVDELLSTWRYRHALMVLRMIGRKTGTGGSAGYGYLKATAESHRVFADLFNLSTFLIPRSSLPALPESLETKLSFHFSQM